MLIGGARRSVGRRITRSPMQIWQGIYTNQQWDKPRCKRASTTCIKGGRVGNDGSNKLRVPLVFILLVVVHQYSVTYKSMTNAAHDVATGPIDGIGEIQCNGAGFYCVLKYLLMIHRVDRWSCQPKKLATSTLFQRQSNYAPLPLRYWVACKNDYKGI